jgi:predicted acylesterase/phospholipase RssA
VLSDLRDPADTLSAVRASCAVALLSGPPQRFRGEPLVDGGFVESVPYRSALREGGTHVLVLRSRDAGFRLPAYRRRTELALRLASPQLASLLRARPQRYNGEAEELEGLASHLRVGRRSRRSRSRQTVAWSHTSTRTSRRSKRASTWSDRDCVAAARTRDGATQSRGVVGAHPRTSEKAAVI